MCARLVEGSGWRSKEVSGGGSGVEEEEEEENSATTDCHKRLSQKAVLLVSTPPFSIQQLGLKHQGSNRG